MIKFEMMVGGLPDYQTDNGSFDYAAIARAVGIRSVRVEQPGGCPSGTGRSAGASRPGARRPGHGPERDLAGECEQLGGRALAALSIPPHITPPRSRGIALAAGNVLLDGGVGICSSLGGPTCRNIPRPAPIS